MCYFSLPDSQSLWIYLPYGKVPVCHEYPGFVCWNHGALFGTHHCEPGRAGLWQRTLYRALRVGGAEYCPGLFGHLAVSKKAELASWFKFHAEAKNEKEKKKAKEKNPGKLLDTNIIIDGRVADIYQTGFLEGPIVVPVFVLEELQKIADSSDVLKRNRGRRGLDILNHMRKKHRDDIKIITDDFEDINEVDSKLIKLAREKGYKIITNDYNLNKVAELQGVTVLNMNDLAIAVKPAVIPGEQIFVQLVKNGKEEGQGVAYLEDGTMIVVEDGSQCIGREVPVIITSVLQTSAGKMIFAKLENEVA